MAIRTLDGRSHVAIGLTIPTNWGVVPFVAPLLFEINEPGVFGSLTMIQQLDVFITSLQLRGHQLVSGLVPATVFAADNPTNPIWGWAFDESTRLRINGFSVGGTGRCTPAVSVLRQPDPDKYPGEPTLREAIDLEINAFGKSNSQLAIGPAAQQDLPAAGTLVEFQMVINETGRLGFLHMPPTADIEVVDVQIQSDDLVSGQPTSQLYTANSFASPGFGHLVNTSTKVFVRCRSNNGGLIPDVCPAFTMLDENMTQAQLYNRRQGTQS